MKLIFHTSIKVHFLFLFFILSFLLYSCKASKSNTSNNATKIKESNEIQSKYSQLLKVNPESIKNITLYKLIDEWLGTPYKYGGNTKSGIDCSNFASIIYSNIYKKTISGSSASIFNKCETISTNDLIEGDLLFFKIERNSISHVGIYLMNNKFVHATTQKGVMINDLNENYYKKYFYKAGRLK